MLDRKKINSRNQFIFINFMHIIKVAFGLN